ncbi:leukocyte elastase inhibitor-like [Brevipalpus obovatus]|uniref:leukocyte elastase inhibitor-like n=1 Tax=Brevipalpus obovatus TaxID=246614 RepID=UPI003D9E6648
MADSRSPLQPALDRFMLNFFKNQLEKDPNANIFFSPFNIELAYSMMIGGSRGSTRDEIIKTLCFNNSQLTPEIIIKEFQKISNLYKEGTPDSTLLSNNLLAISKKFNVKPEFMKMVKDYKTTILNENFDDPAKVQTKLNSLIAEKTKNVIPKVLDEAPDKNTAMMMLNTMYFKGMWNQSFNPNDNTTYYFFNADGTRRDIPFMWTKDIIYCRSAVLMERNKKFIHAVELFYKDSISFYFLKPIEDYIPMDIVKKVDDYLFLLLNSTRPHHLNLIAMPRIKINQSYELDKILPTMGMKLPFTDKADFSGISNEKLKVTKSIHKTVVEIQTQSSQAAEANYVRHRRRVDIAKNHLQINVFYIQRPFMFLIRDRSNSITLFAGIINTL